MKRIVPAAAFFPGNSHRHFVHFGLILDGGVKIISRFFLPLKFTAGDTQSAVIPPKPELMTVPNFHFTFRKFLLRKQTSLDNIFRNADDILRPSHSFNNEKKSGGEDYDSDQHFGERKTF